MVGRYGYIGFDLQLFIEKFSTDKRFFFVYHHWNIEKTTLSGVWPRFLSAHDVIEDITC